MALLAPPTVIAPPPQRTGVRPAFSPRRSAPAHDRMIIVGLTVAGALLRLPNLGRAYWIDEGISVGIASHRLGQIPGLLRVDGSPPLFYLLLHVWLRVFGPSEISTHTMTVLISLGVIPLAWWSANQLFGRPAAICAAALAATSPFLAWYATETRMYPLVAVLSLIAVTLAVRAADRASARDAVVAVLAFALLLYTHDWAIYAVVAAAAVLAVDAVRKADRRQLLWVSAAAGGLALVYLPWVPTFLTQARHTAAPWAVAPALGHFFADPAAMFAGTLAVFVGPALGLGLLLSRPARWDSRTRSAAAVLGAIGVFVVVEGWLAAQLDPSWANRYLTVAFPALLVGSAGVMAATRRGRQLAVGTVVVLAAWNIVGALLPNANARFAKSNVAAVAGEARSYVHPGDLVVVTQSEQLAVVAYYLPAGLTFATPTGVVADPTFVDWRNLVPRLEAADPCRALAPALAALPLGAHVLVINPGKPLGARGTRWSNAVNHQVASVNELLNGDPELQRLGSFMPATHPAPFSPVDGMLFVKTGQFSGCP